MEPSEPERIDADFRAGSLTAISVIVGFSLSFLSRWAATPGTWHRLDLAAVGVIVVGIACQVAALAALLRVGSLRLPVYNRSITVFLCGLALVAAGVLVALVGDLTGWGQGVLGG